MPIVVMRVMPLEPPPQLLATTLPAPQNHVRQESNMGFAIAYRTTEPVDHHLASRLRAAASAASAAHTWLSCEPPILQVDDGHLLGISKPNFMPHPDDVASAETEGLPDGTVNDLLDLLCKWSSDFAVDWEISHDYSDGPLGYIRDGVCDSDVRTQCEAFGQLAEDMLEEGFDFPEA
jgi:hypothetical protein